MKPVTYTRAALKALRKMPVDLAERIIRKIETVKKLTEALGITLDDIV